MKLVRARLCNFQCFGPDPTDVEFSDMTFLLGPNGAGKTAALQGLARMFSLDPTQRKIRRSDFHVPADEDPDEKPETRELWVQADFEFPELGGDDADARECPAVPGNFAHMSLLSADGPARVRFRLKATLDQDDEIEENLTYVMSVDDDDAPVEESRVTKQDRNAIQVHYLPARRDPADHISYSATTLLGRALRAANWTDERDQVNALTQQISDSLAANDAIDGIAKALSSKWGGVHKGDYYANPAVSFARNEIDGLLRHLSVGFSPGHGEALVDFSRLSDGQQSLLYVSLVLAMLDLGRRVLRGELDAAFDVDKLRPAVFTLIAIEEPENSLSPHYLGRVVRAMKDFSDGEDAQAVIATHSPSLLRRVPPEAIRYFRLGDKRTTLVKCIKLPNEKVACKFVREAVQAYPELYFSRLVILGEGDSEEIVLPRLLEARGILADDASISVVPLGGRHVNHFWRLLCDLGIPHVTLLDLDLARYQGGWGRVKYAADQLLKYSDVSTAYFNEDDVEEIPRWDDDQGILIDDDDWFTTLEDSGVFFSTPLDLDFMMLLAFPAAYAVKAGELKSPDEVAVKAVLGKNHDLESQYTPDQQRYFDVYHQRFKLGSKPAAHLRAMANLSDADLVGAMPSVLDRLLDRIEAELKAIPE